MNLGYPGLPNSNSELIVIQPAIETLCRYTSDGELEPWLCESYEADAESLTLTVKLKEGITFQDGTDFNAEAVKWNWEQFQAVGRSEIAAIESIECTDEYTVVAHMSEWDNTLADNALHLAGYMYSPTYAEENGQDAANSNPVGTGPYTFVEWEKDVKLVYEKNENYWGEDELYLDGIEIDFITDANTLATAYQSGELDVAIASDTSVIQIMESAGIENKAADGLTGEAAISLVAYGCTDESSPTSDLLVRQAFAYAVDWEELCEAVGGMYYTNQWAIPGVWSYNEETEGYPYDVEKAQELLAEAGYADGVEITCYTLEANNTLATMIQQYVADAGITLTIENIDQARQDEMAGINGNWDGIILSAGRVDTEIASIYARSFTDDGVRYVGGFLHPDDLVEGITNARSATTQEDQEYYSQMIAKMVIDDYCMISPIGITSGTIYMQDYVEDTGLMQTHMVLWTPETCKLTE